MFLQDLKVLDSLPLRSTIPFQPSMHSTQHLSSCATRCVTCSKEGAAVSKIRSTWLFLENLLIPRTSSLKQRGFNVLKISGGSASETVETEYAAPPNEWQLVSNEEARNDKLTEDDFSDCSYEYQEIKPELRQDPSAPPTVLGAQVLIALLHNSWPARCFAQNARPSPNSLHLGNPGLGLRRGARLQHRGRHNAPPPIPWHSRAAATQQQGQLPLLKPPVRPSLPLQHRRQKLDRRARAAAPCAG